MKINNLLKLTKRYAYQFICKLFICYDIFVKAISTAAVIAFLGGKIIKRQVSPSIGKFVRYKILS
jgi:hypothetical protein